MFGYLGNIVCWKIKDFNSEIWKLTKSDILWTDLLLRLLDIMFSYWMNKYDAKKWWKFQNTSFVRSGTTVVFSDVM